MKTKQAKTIFILVTVSVIAVVGGLLGWYFTNNGEKNNSNPTSLMGDNGDNYPFVLVYNITLTSMNGRLEIYVDNTDSLTTATITTVSRNYHISIQADDSNNEYYADGMDDVDLCFTNHRPTPVPAAWNYRDNPDSVCVYGVNHLAVFPHGLSNKVDVSQYQYALFVERIRGTTLGIGRYQTFASAAPTTTNSPSFAPTPMKHPDSQFPWTKTELVRGTDDYDIRGTIYLRSRFEPLANGTLAEIPFLYFENMYMYPMPPALYLYLSKETNWGRLNDDDVFIPIRDITALDDLYVQVDSFSLKGTSEEDFTTNVNIRDYIGGSWKAWCTTFEISLAGGIIEEI